MNSVSLKPIITGDIFIRKNHSSQRVQPQAPVRGWGLWRGQAPEEGILSGFRSVRSEDQVVGEAAGLGSKEGGVNAAYPKLHS